MDDNQSVTGVDRYSLSYDEENLSNIYYYFKEMLILHPLAITDQHIMSVPLTNSRQKVINIDCLRTRAPTFNSSIRNELEHVLTYYCQANGKIYKQGMNEVAAPFLYIRRGGATVAEAYTMFVHFFNKFCLNFYDDENFNSVELFVKMFSVVLKYHDPALFRYLEWHDIEPQIFCISWLMTLFSSKLSFHHVFELWAFIVAENDQYFIFFIVLAIVLTNRDNILEQKDVNILQIVTNLIFTDDQSLKVVIERALLLRKDTPSSLILLFRDRCVFEVKEKQEDYACIHHLIQNIANLNLFLVLPAEITLQQHLAKGICQRDCYFCDLRKPIPISPVLEHTLTPTAHLLIQVSNQVRQMRDSREYVLVDMRKDKRIGLEWDRVFRVDVGESIEKVEEKFISAFMEEKNCKHFLFILTTFSFENLEMSDDDEFEMCKGLLSALNSMSFPLLGILEGGFHGLQSQSRVEEKKIGTGISLSHEEVIDKIPFTWKLSIGDRFDIATALLAENIGYEEGLIEILIFTEYFILVCEKQKELLGLLNHFQHSSSPMQYLYQKTHEPASILIRRVIPLSALKKAAMKIHHPNVLVLTYDSCHHFQDKFLASILELLNMDMDRFVKALRKCEDCQSFKRKVVVEMNGDEMVKECAGILSKRYGRLLKKIRRAEEELSVHSVKTKQISLLGSHSIQMNQSVLE